MRKVLSSLVLAGAVATAGAAPLSVSNLVGMLPEGSAAVVAVDIAALRAQPIVQSWLLEHSAPWSGVDADTTGFLAEAGLDPVRDVDLMVVAVRDGAQDDPLVLFAGRYDPSSLGAALVKRGAEKTEIAGLPAYRLHEVSQTEPKPSTPFLTVSDELVMVGSEEAIAAANASGVRGASVVSESVRLGHLDLSAPFWMAVEIPQRVSTAAGDIEIGSDTSNMQAVDGLLRATASVRRVVMSARVSDLLEIKSIATATSEENAELLSDAVKGVIAAARLQAQEQHPEVVDALRKVKVAVDGSTLTVFGSVPIELLQRIAGHGDHQESRTDI